MNLATALIVLVANHGYWMGGETYTIDFAWVVKGGMPHAQIEWRLLVDELELANGRTPLEAGAETASIRIAAPEVRVPTEFELRYVVRADDGDGGRELTRGSQAIRIFPPTRLDAVRKRLDGQSIAVWDTDEGLPRVLATDEVPFTRIAGAASLLTTGANLILVGPDMIEDEQVMARLRSQAQRGAGIILFRQTRVRRLGEYPVVPRAAVRMQWRLTHPLLTTLPEAAWQSMVREQEWAIELPATQAALELCWWPSEIPNRGPVTIHALLATQTIGKGRIVFCQLHTGDWSTDPRSGILLRSALDYLLTRPEATPAPVDRPELQTKALSPDAEEKK